MAGSARIDELRKKFEENPRRYFAPLANEYRKAGDFNQAIAICREYLPQQPGHMSGHIVFGQALYEARQFDESKGVFETALTLDPENLIALKHLGDIALIGGNTEGARGWYKKILDADPRNEEILAQLAKLEQKAQGAKVGATMVMAAVPRPGSPPKAPKPAAPTPPAATPAQAAPKPPSASAPTPVVPAPPVQAAKPAPPPPVASAPPVVTATSPTAEIRLDTIPTHAETEAPPAPEMTIGFEPTSAGVSSADITPAPGLEIDTPVSANREAPLASSGGLEGLETTSLAAAAAEPEAAPLDLDLSVPAPAPAAPPPTPPAAAAAQVDEINLDFSPPAAPAPAAPVPPAAAPEINLDFAAPAAAPEPSAPPPAATVDLDFVASPASSPPAPEPVAAQGDDLPLLDLGELPSAPPAAPPAPVAAAAPAPAAAPPAAPPGPEQAVELSPATAPQSGPFVTETMAELYLQQGHPDEALKVYRALLDKRPNETALAQKVAALETQLRGPIPSAAPSAPVVSISPLPPASGPSMRDLLAAIAMRRPGSPASIPGNGGAVAAVAEGSAPGPDGLAQLFGAVEVNPIDEAAAIALASAFATNNGHHATAEPPLVPGGQSAAAPGFSFDQFFSARATAEHGATTGAQGAAGASRDDVAQFSQWLEGLKQK